MTEDFNPTEWITIKEVTELKGYLAAHFGQLIGRGGVQVPKIVRKQAR